MAWMLYVLGTGALLAVAALAIDNMLRRSKLPTRWVWVAALAGIAVLAVIAPRSDAPATRSTTTAAVVPFATPEATVRAPGVATRIARARDDASAAVSAFMTAAEVRGESLALPFGIAWIAASSALLSLLVIVTMRANLARGRWPRAEVEGIAVRVAPATGPAVIGLARPDIVLPGWLMQRPAHEQHLVVVHEREHVAARDQLLPLGAWLVVALLPWHPAAWWAMSRLRLAIELDCDARVLHRGVQPRSYGSLLIDIAGQCAGHRIGALALADRPSHLERRLLAMKQARSRIGIARAGMLSGIAALAIVMACEARIPTAADVDNMDVAEVERAALRSKLIERRPGDSLQFYVNDLLVSEGEAKKIGAKWIASVKVNKTGGANGVYVTTIDSLNMKKSSGALLPTRRTGVMIDSVPAGISRLKTPVGNAVVYVDGVKSSSAVLAKMGASAIESIEVLKGAAAAAAYSDADAVNGVIVVKTKKP